MNKLFKYFKVYVNLIELSIIVTTAILITAIYHLKVDKVSFSILTSLIASGIFYIITIFIPKCTNLWNMKKNIISYMLSIFEKTDITIRFINKGNEKYTLEEFYDKKLFNDPKFREDFLSYYGREGYDKQLEKIFTNQLDAFNCILFNYSTLLPNYINKAIINVISVSSNEIKNFDGELYNLELHYNQYFETFTQIFLINTKLNELYNFEWNNTMTMQIRY